jgi:hypothetical protein
LRNLEDASPRFLGSKSFFILTQPNNLIVYRGVDAKLCYGAFLMTVVMQKLSKTEFIDALKKGKGRALMHVREFGDDGIEDEILHACLHSLAYDPPFEDYRGPWMFDLISHTRNPDLYHHSILSSFIASSKEWDVSQMSAMLALLAKRGYPGAREILYRKFDLQEFSESTVIGKDLIALDGIQAMLHIADVIGRRIQSDAEYWEYNTLIEQVSESLGKEKTEQALQEAARHSQSIRAYVDRVIASSGCLVSSDGERNSSPVPKRAVPLREFLSEIEKAPRGRGYCFSFGKSATPQDIQELYAMLAVEQDRGKLLRYLWIFCRAKLPEVSEFMLELAGSADVELRGAALTALANVKDRAVRDFALRLLNDGELVAVELLRNNFAEGDFEYIIERLHANADPDEVHRCGMDVLSICGAHERAEAADCLIWVYENTPCALCRNDAVRKLIEIDRLPRVLAEECLSDCEEETRKDVAAYVPNALG